MSAGVELRAASAEDYQFLEALHEAAMRPYVEAIWGWSDAFQVQFFRDHFKPARLRVIELDGQAVGVIGYDLDAERLYLGPIEVHPQSQGHGIGAAAITDVLSIAESAGVPATLQVLQINTGAKRLYERLGFEVTSTTENHFLMRRPVGR